MSEVAIDVECQDEENSFHTTYKIEKYTEYKRRLESAMSESFAEHGIFPDFRVNPPPGRGFHQYPPPPLAPMKGWYVKDRAKVRYPRLGAFEVTIRCSGDLAKTKHLPEGPVLIFSKLKSHKWPNVSKLAAECASAVAAGQSDVLKRLQSTAALDLASTRDSRPESPGRLDRNPSMFFGLGSRGGIPSPTEVRTPGSPQRAPSVGRLWPSSSSSAPSGRPARPQSAPGTRASSSSAPRLTKGRPASASRPGLRAADTAEVTKLSVASDGAGASAKLPPRPPAASTAPAQLTTKAPTPPSIAPSPDPTPPAAAPPLLHAAPSPAVLTAPGSPIAPKPPAPVAPSPPVPAATDLAQADLLAPPILQAAEAALPPVVPHQALVSQAVPTTSQATPQHVTSSLEDRPHKDKIQPVVATIAPQDVAPFPAEPEYDSFEDDPDVVESTAQKQPPMPPMPPSEQLSSKIQAVCPDASATFEDDLEVLQPPASAHKAIAPDHTATFEDDYDADDFEEEDGEASPKKSNLKKAKGGQHPPAALHVPSAAPITPSRSPQCSADSILTPQADSSSSGRASLTERLAADAITTNVGTSKAAETAGYSDDDFEEQVVSPAKEGATITPPKKSAGSECTATRASTTDGKAEAAQAAEEYNDEDLDFEDEDCASEDFEDDPLSPNNHQSVMQSTGGPKQGGSTMMAGDAYDYGGDEFEEDGQSEGSREIFEDDGGSVQSA